MNSQKFLGSFLGATMIFSQVEGFIPDVSAKSDNLNNKLSTSSKIAIGVGAGAGVVGALSFILWKCLQDVNAGTDETDVPVRKQLDDVDIVVNFDDWFDREKNCVTGSRVDKFFEVHKLARGFIQPQIVTNIRRNFLTDKNSKNGHWNVENFTRNTLYDQDSAKFCNEHIWIQYGPTEKDVISYKYLHKILWNYKNSNHKPLEDFLNSKQSIIHRKFISALQESGYGEICEKLFPNNTSEGSNHCRVQVLPSTQVGGNVSNSGGNGVTSAPNVAGDGNINLGYGILKYIPAPDMPKCSSRCFNLGVINSKGKPMFSDTPAGDARRKDNYSRVTSCDTGCPVFVPMRGEWKNDARWLAFVNDEMLDRANSEHVSIFTGFYDFQNGDIKELKAKSGAGTGTGFYKLASKIADERGKSYPANVAEILEYGESLGCRKMGFVDPANMVFPCGAVTVSRTLEETAGTQSTMVAAMNSNMMAGFYSDAKTRDIWERLGVITGVRFYRSKWLVSGATGTHGDRQGLNPEWLNPNYQAKTLLSDENSIETTVFVTGFNKNEQIDDEAARLWARNLAITAEKMGIDFLVLSKVGAGSFNGKDIYAHDGIVAKEFSAYAPNVKVVVFDQSERSGDGMANYKQKIKDWATANRPDLLQYLR